MSQGLKTILTTQYPQAVKRRAGKVFFTKPGEGSSWFTNWTFAPDYANGLSADGLWSARQLWSKNDWINDSDFDEDMGVAIINARNGQHIVSRVGGQGFTVNKGKTYFEVAYGYPGEAPFTGQTLQRCSGTTSPEWSVWLAWNSGTGYLNSVNSRINRIVGPTIMLSPYFDD